MKKVFFAAAAIIALQFSLSAQELSRAIRVDDMPTSAKTFLMDHLYNDMTDIKEIMTRNGTVDGYRITFVNGTKMAFDKEGNWQSIENSLRIPYSIIPQNVRTVMQEEYPQQVVTGIARDAQGNVKLTLDDGSMIRYRANGTLY